MWSSLQRLSSSHPVVHKSRYWWRKAANWNWSEEAGFFILNVMVKTHNVLCRFLTFAPDLSQPHTGTLFIQWVDSCPPLFSGIPFSQQLSPNEPTEMFLLQFPSLAIKTSVRLSRGPAGSSLPWLAREQSACSGYRVRPKRGAEGPGLESASCGPGESAVCGSVANTKRSTSSGSNRTRRGEPGPPRCSWSICLCSSHLKT